MERKFDVLLVDSSEESRLLMKEAVERDGEFRVVAQTGSGTEALELARRLRPDVVVTEAKLPGMDGFALMDELEGLVPGTVMVTGCCQSEVLMEATRRRIHFLPKPYREDILLIMLRHACHLIEEYHAPRRWEAQATHALHVVGVPAHIKGYAYVRRAILMVAENPKLGHALTKELYPALARQFGTRTSCVERAIRSAVEAAWMRGDPEVQREYFTEDKPSNGAFIAALAAKLRAGYEDSVA